MPNTRYNLGLIVNDIVPQNPYNKALKIKKNIEAELYDILDKVEKQELLDQNLKLKEENIELRKRLKFILESKVDIKKLTIKKSELEKDLEYLQAEVNFLIHGEQFLPVGLLNLQSGFRSFLRNQEISFVSKKNCLKLFKLENIRSLGSTRIEQLRSSIDELRNSNYQLKM